MLTVAFAAVEATAAHLPQPRIGTGQKVANMIGVALPFVAFLVAVVLLWNSFVGWLDLGIMAVLYVLTGLGITVGYHRLLTHRAFQTSKPVQYTFAILGSMSVQGPVLHWVADHRKHHAHTDEEGDPHSPHLAGRGFLGALKGLWHAHVGWLFSLKDRAEPERYARDWLEDRGMRVIDKLFLVWLALGIAVPFGIGYAAGGTLTAALSAALWGGLVRIFFLHHVTFSINSVCHFFGRRSFATEDESRNVFWLAPLSFGESWHNNHHAFPRSAFHGLRWYQVDPGRWVIALLEKLGLAWNVVRISPARQAEKLAR
jgi:stearoyl-CoA desaturase (delta-9 desaturase)